MRLIVACGGLGQHAPSEAEVIAALCETRGVSKDALLLEERSTTTEENLRFALPFLADRKPSEVVIVTDRYHAPRARLMARRLGLIARTDCPPLPNARRLRVVRQVLREVPAYAWYWFTKR